MKFPDYKEQETILAQCRLEADRFSLPIKKHLLRGLAGNIKASGQGNSIDFKDHRQYMPGDDPRYINWHAYARTEQYTMKVYHEEVRPTIDLILDNSHSMVFENDKTIRTLECLFFCVYSAFKSGIKLNFHTSNQLNKALHTENIINARLTEEHFTRDSHHLASLNNLKLSKGSLRIFISDLLFSDDPMNCLKHLSSAGCSLIILAPTTLSERDPDWNGHMEFIECENGVRNHQYITPAKLNDYKKSYQMHFAQWRELCLKYGALFSHSKCEIAFSDYLSQQALNDTIVQPAS